MKSNERSSKSPKQPNSNNLNPKPEFVAYRPVEKQKTISQPDSTPNNESVPEVKLQVLAEKEPQNVSDDKLLPLEKAKAKSIYADKSKSSSPTQAEEQRHIGKSESEFELSPEKCQHVRFLDCDEAVGRIIFECWHCQQGILSQYTGKPVMGEYKGRPSPIQLKIQCPNCEQTAIRLTTGEVLSTTAIPSPWQQGSHTSCKSDC
ncbi:hypothetical protein [Nostoc sp. ChiQUE01b]|uniref:hypothetical protein n=1 Tax=Nostoc sp. ChiQUE01b TaxID=3075376 RepID=UPI002AD55395|nr:hypothetical protein [Nostoc sp. ChiQUE01b]MDZ8263610.1 hypothetical protein [Nostoc sp. ChiQUE01b]